MKGVVTATFFALALLGCDETVDDGFRRRTAPNASESAATTCADTQKSYAGFGGTKLEAGRMETTAGMDRGRMKPFSALNDEYKRVLGAAPKLLGESGPTFGEAPARWYAEPHPGAVNLYQAYRIAFEGCLEYTKTDPKWEAAPTNDAAVAECSAMQRKFWSRTPIPGEIDVCVEAAVTASATETVAGGATKATEPRRRWAYACAAVLTGSGFLFF